MTRIFLALVGLACIALAVCCSVLPESTSSHAVGFSLQSGSGQSEFLRVYSLRWKWNREGLNQHRLTGTLPAHLI